MIHLYKGTYKIGGQEGKTGPAGGQWGRGWGLWHQSGRGDGRERGEEDEYGAKNVCIYMYVNAKMIPVETSRNGGRGDKEEWWRG
jgi:hypothetical protein